MLTLLFVLSESKKESTCDASTVLPHGATCCNSQICTGYCLGYEWFDTTRNITINEKFCASKTEKIICEDVEIGYFVVMVPFLIPTIIALIIACVKHINLPVSTWLLDLINNICLGTLIYGSSCSVHYTDRSIPLICVGFIVILLIGIFKVTNTCYGCDCGKGKDFSERESTKISNAIDHASSVNCSCQCCVVPEDKETTCCKGYECLDVFKMINSPIITPEDFNTVIEENHVIPPSPQIKTIDFARGGKGEVYIDQERYLDIEYGSWQEETEIPKIDDHKIIVYTCHSEYEYDDDMKDAIQKAKDDSKALYAKSSYWQAFVDVSETPGITHRAICVNGKSKLVDFCSSCFMTKFLYQLLIFLGYTSVSDVIWLSNVYNINETSFKKISSDASKLRAKKGERDRILYKLETA